MAVRSIAGSAAKAAGAAQDAADANGNRALATCELLSAPSRRYSRQPRFVFAASCKLRPLAATIPKHSSSGEVTAFHLACQYG